jgi:hypothetical protein
MKLHPARRPQSRPASRLSSLLLVSGLTLIGLGCKAPPRKSTVFADWSRLEAVNPTDVAISKIDPAMLPRELRPEVLRDAIKEQVVAHRYSPLSFEYLDRGGAVEAMAGAGANGERSAGAGTVARLDLVVKKFDLARYAISNQVHAVGDFYLRSAGDGETLATVQVDQVFDLSAEGRRNASLEEVARTAARRFVFAALEPMPMRRVDSNRPSR